MSVVSVNLKTQESGRSKDELTASRSYVVEVSDPANDTSETARLACPGIGSYFGNSAARCTSSRAAMIDEDPCFYLVSLDYSSKYDPTEAEENPLARPAKFSYSDTSVSVPFFRDRSRQPDGWTGLGADGMQPPDPDDPDAEPRPWTGKPIVNSAGDQFADLPERFESQGSITISRNEIAYNDAVAETWKNTANADSVTLNGVIYSAGQLLMGSITAEGPNTESYTDQSGTVVTVTYWTIGYTVHKRVQTWDLVLEDRGLNELSGEADDSDRQLTPILAQGTAVALPYPLDGTGKARATPTEAPAQLTFKPYTGRTWAGHAFV